MKQYSIDRFSFSRVLKMLRLDMSYNKNLIVIVLLCIAVITTILYAIASGLGDSDAGLAMLWISFMFSTSIICVFMISLFCKIVFNRLNRDNPMHISLIPVGVREKYMTIVSEFVILNIVASVIISALMYLTCVLSVGLYDNNFDVYLFFDSFKDIFEQVFESISGDNDMLYIMNIIGFSYILFISPAIMGFGILSSACIICNRGWKVLLFLIGAFFAVQVIFGFLTFSFELLPKHYYGSELMSNILYYGIIVMATVLNISFIYVGYRKLKTKQNKRL